MAHVSRERMKGTLSLVSAALLAALCVATAAGAQTPFGRVQKAKLDTAWDRLSYAPGSTARLAAIVDVDEGWHIQSHTPSFEYLIPTELELELPDGFAEPQLTYPDHKMWQSGFEAEPLAVYDGQTILIAEIEIPADVQASSLELEVTLRYQACDDRVCVAPTKATQTVTLPLGGEGELTAADIFAADSSTPSSAAPLAPGRLALMIGLGLLGGLILNAMPCVLPILSLKMFSLVKAAGQSHRYIVFTALATVAGILFSFWALALMVIGVRTAGGAVGWGIQFQNPLFVVFLTLVVVLFSLNLWELFEVPLPSRIANWASSGHREGLLGHFTTGLFATLMATPCSAPFLGTAVGFALSQSSLGVLLMFTAIGVGMALPYLLLAAFPGFARVLPKPGPWMQTVRVVMGFFLAGTAVWLFYVLANQISPERLAFLQGGVLLMALFAWLHSAAQPASLKARAAAMLMALSAAGVLWLAWGSDPAAASSTATQTRIAWQPFDRAEAESLAGSGAMVFVDVTADWCATCKVNERLVLETDEMVELFERYGVTAMKADWTNRNDAISSYLADFGRYAIPFYVLYRPGRDPHIFGELLTKASVRRVLEESSAIASAR